MNHFSKAPESFNTEVTLEQWEALKSDISNRIAGAQEAQAAADQKLKEAEENDDKKALQAAVEGVAAAQSLMAFDEFWEHYFKSARHCSTFDQILRIVAVRMILPLANAPCERGFSCMNGIKTDKRNRMGSSLLSMLMMVNINGPAISDKRAVHDICMRAYKLWCAAKARNSGKSVRCAKPKKNRKSNQCDAKAVLEGIFDASDDDEQDDVTNDANDDINEDSVEADVMAEEGQSDNVQESQCLDDFVPPDGFNLVSKAPEELTTQSLKGK
ncbi:hypothetical protein CYMTET_21210 [Cymbomonas tetramitiformis]|uniref:HAT C-terminal dimerisation domain-containing protein n=1 Tax=Cymbomonas tetramitiformis TaxID=36881 RepID=A0AAE0L3E3_9CHLO|nr:hypothetical protein CYMTET_21210 [Cymbomonas tetramitiformis]